MSSSAGTSTPARARARKSKGALLPGCALSELEGVGPRRAERLARLGLRTLRDLLLYVPRALEPAARSMDIASARQALGITVELRGTLRALRLVRAGRGRSLVRATLEDGSGCIEALWFNQPWRRRRMAVGDELCLRGCVVDARGPALLMPQTGTPERPLSPQPAFTPVYAVGRGLGQEYTSQLARTALARAGAALADPLPPDVLVARGLPSLAEAARALHAPDSEEAWRRARRRVALEALLYLQARWLARARARQTGHATRVKLPAGERARLLALFPFALTSGQLEIVRLLERELERELPMRRLLQGDVGSGKTALGLYACMLVARSGRQAAFLAPTELLAQQHHCGARDLLGRAGLSSWLLTGSLASPERAACLRDLDAGRPGVVFGTHALYSPDVRFACLALALIDEQQRFGVAQRRALLDKGRDAHLLLMTATPIPRTLALSLYGELELCTLREKPGGRGELRTRWVRAHELERMHAWLAARLERGQRAFWVLPRIDSICGGRGAEQAQAELCASTLGRHGVELVHGRLPSEQRAAALQRFRRGEARLLVATSVIEVGVDVPEATCIVIEGAERFGLAQLHQLRGRVGRGPDESWCLLLGDQAAAERLSLLEREHDGFAIAEADLCQRGMGDLAGLRQAGANREGLLDPAFDLDLLTLARELVTSNESVRRSYASA